VIRPGGALWKRAVRTAVAGVLAALAVLGAGALLERNRFGPTDEDARQRVEREIRRRFDQSAESLASIARRVADADLVRDIRAAERDKGATERLFRVLDASLADAPAGAGLTLFASDGTPIAWSGRTVRVPKERLDTRSALFVAPDAFGPRLISIQPVLDRDGQHRVGSIAAEQPAIVTNLLVPVTLQTRFPGRASDPYRFEYPAAGDNELRIEARIDPTSLAAAREAWRRRRNAASIAVLVLALLVGVAPLIEARRQTRTPGRLIVATGGLAGLFIGVAVLLRMTVAAFADDSGRAAADLLLVGGLLLTVVILALDAIERWRVSALRPRLDLARGPAVLRTFLLFAGAGLVDTGLVWSYERFLRQVVFDTPLDVLDFSLLPLQASRLAAAFGFALLAAAVTWGAALAVHFAGIASRTRRKEYLRVWIAVAWVTGVLGGVLILRTVGSPLPNAPFASALAAVAGCAFLLARPRGRLRRASQAARLFGVYVALLVPAIAMYPSLHAFAVEATEWRIADSFGPDAARVREDLQRQLEQALAEIDAMPALASLVAGESTPSIDRADSTQAYSIWSQTALNRTRQTSALELYGPTGQLLSRFSLKLPERPGAGAPATTCRHGAAWDVVEEASHVLRASKALCAEGGSPVGSIVVRAMLDYRVLPFIASQEPYSASLRPTGLTPAAEAVARDVTFVVYGWSRAPSYSSGLATWELPDAVFDRMVRSRQPFWSVLTRNDERYRVYFLSDRGGIYALGYPTTTTFGHLMNLAELVILTGVLYLLLLVGATVFNALTGLRPASGRALLREIRSSFYRKLFLASVSVAIIPAAILAYAARSRLAGQFEANVRDEAIRTATVAQRLVEDYAQRLVEAVRGRRGSEALNSLDDSIMMLVARPIDQDVSLYDGATLQATSQRDLYASYVMPTRTPADVYRAIVLQRLPTFRGVEPLGDSTYQVAAAPVRAGGSERIVTVPLTLRDRELQQQIADLDRRVWSAFVLFVLIGGSLGYWTAERIADPVNRLTRATRRIARGDLDARIAATSSDELRRLVEDFNRMADDLKRQRVQLERTQRLEAWADMARQVAHDVKNPLTPIQLSAEHALRINIDRGRPLSPVLDECVNAILHQVKLLREISTEFSSFASSPTARPEPTDVAALVQEVVSPYRAGLTETVALAVDAPHALPLASIDRTLFSRALTNVIENALHAMPGGGGLTITVSYRAEDPAIVVTITDTGVGMDEEAVRRMFEPYFSTKARGTGLGMTIAKRNVELNGGTIAVHSARDLGTTVTITLPLAAA
jgi:signal transduction histidine kinase